MKITEKKKNMQVSCEKSSAGRIVRLKLDETFPHLFLKYEAQSTQRKSCRPQILSRNEKGRMISNFALR